MQLHDASKSNWYNSWLAGRFFKNLPAPVAGRQHGSRIKALLNITGVAGDLTSTATLAFFRTGTASYVGLNELVPVFDRMSGQRSAFKHSSRRERMSAKAVQTSASDAFSK